MSDTKPTALPAPLSLSLDEIRSVAGGVTLLPATALFNFKPWFWFGQPVSPIVTPVNIGVATFG